MNEENPTTPPGLDPTTLSRYQVPSIPRSVRQLLNSVLPFLALWVAMVWSLSVSYWLTLGLALVASGFLVRIFIIFHDCGHGSFFGSRRANEWVGFFTGLLTLTPHHQWWREHSLHHARAGNLDRRGSGDIWTLTVSEYRAAPLRTRILYRLVRNPFFMLTVGPFLTFAVKNRFPSSSSRARERRSVLWTNLALAAIVTALCLTIGWKAYLAIHLPVILFSGAAGIWLFYVQHQFEGVYWRRDGACDFVQVALQGSSYYRLPRMLQWFSGNIGFHHIHHLNSRIPNYLLEKCHRDIEAFQRVHALTLRTSLDCLRHRLWDEERQCLVGFGALRESRPTAS